MSEPEDLVAAADPDRYVASLFAPAARRPGLFALYAFDHEVGRIAAVVHEPMVGHIRLAWWRQQIDAIYAGQAVHAPVARALAAAVGTYTLPREQFDRSLDARAFDLEEAPFADEAALVRHAEGTVGAILQLAARILGADARADQACLDAGLAVACARHLGGLEATARLRRCRLPTQWLDEAGLGTEDVFAAQMSPPFRGVVQRLAAVGETALRRLNGRRFPLRATSVLSVAAPLNAHFRAVRSPTFDPFRAAPDAPRWRRVARIALANLTWRI